MIHVATIALLASTLLHQPATSPATSAPKDMTADSLAADVMRASGAAVWPRVKRVRFTFNVDRPDGSKSGRTHDWDLRKRTDTVTTTDGKTMTARLDGPNETEDAKRAFAAWTNDTYWLMAPLKVMDGGVVRSMKDDVAIEGKTYHVLHLSFESVGLTPTDQYDLFVDPESKLVRWWDFIPAKGEPRRFSWDEYKDFSGVKLSTEHKVNGKPAITFTDVQVTVE